MKMAPPMCGHQRGRLFGAAAHPVNYTNGDTGRHPFRQGRNHTTNLGSNKDAICANGASDAGARAEDQHLRSTLRQPGDQRPHVVIQHWQRLFREGAVKIIDVLILDLIHEERKLLLHHLPVFGFFDGDNQI